MFGYKSIFAFLLVLFVSYLTHFIGIFHKTDEYQEKYSNCQYLETDLSLHGSEDSVLFSKDILIGIHANMHKIFSGQEPLDKIEKGGFYAVYGISTGKLVTKKVQVKNYPQDIFFIPHGIYLYGSNRLNVINHSFYTGGERVESYNIVLTKEGEIVLEFLHSTRMEPKFNGITNDVVFLTEERFFITDWQVFTIPLKGNSEKSILEKIGTILAWVSKLKTTNLWDCKYIIDGISQCVKVKNSSGIMMNGAAFDGVDTLAVTDTLDKVVKIFKLNQNKELELIQNLHIGYLVDNISYDFTNKQFIVGGTNTVIEYLTLNKKLHQVQDNKANKSTVEYSGRIDTMHYNPTTKLYENKMLFQSLKTVVGLAGGVIDQSQKYLFINSFPDKSLVVCTKTN